MENQENRWSKKGKVKDTKSYNRRSASERIRAGRLPWAHTCNVRRVLTAELISVELMSRNELCLFCYCMFHQSTGESRCWSGQWRGSPLIHIWPLFSVRCIISNPLDWWSAAQRNTTWWRFISTCTHCSVMIVIFCNVQKALYNRQRNV